jgi:hypothetical protein
MEMNKIDTWTLPVDVHVGSGGPPVLGSVVDDCGFPIDFITSQQDLVRVALNGSTGLH